MSRQHLPNRVWSRAGRRLHRLSSALGHPACGAGGGAEQLHVRPGIHRAGRRAVRAVRGGDVQVRGRQRRVPAVSARRVRRRGLQRVRRLSLEQLLAGRLHRPRQLHLRRRLRGAGRALRLRRVRARQREARRQRAVCSMPSGLVRQPKCHAGVPDLPRRHVLNARQCRVPGLRRQRVQRAGVRLRLRLPLRRGVLRCHPTAGAVYRVPARILQKRNSQGHGKSWWQLCVWSISWR